MSQRNRHFQIVLLFAAVALLADNRGIGSDGSPTRIWVGTLRDGAKQLPIDVKFSGFLLWVRYRCVVRGNVGTTYLNGLAVRTEQLTSQDPWIAVRSCC